MLSKHLRGLLVSMVAGLLFSVGTTSGAAKSLDSGAQPVRARLELERKTDCLLARLYLHNTSSEDVKLVTGNGGVNKSMDIWFLCNSKRCIGARWTSYAFRRDMRPEFTVLPANRETLFDSYLLPFPDPECEDFSAGRPTGKFTISTTVDFYTDPALRDHIQVTASAVVPEPKK